MWFSADNSGMAWTNTCLVWVAYALVFSVTVTHVEAAPAPLISVHTMTSTPATTRTPRPTSVHTQGPTTRQNTTSSISTIVSRGSTEPMSGQSTETVRSSIPTVTQAATTAPLTVSVSPSPSPSSANVLSSTTSKYASPKSSLSKSSTSTSKSSPTSSTSKTSTSVTVARSTSTTVASSTRAVSASTSAASSSVVLTSSAGDRRQPTVPPGRTNQRPTGPPPFAGSTADGLRNSFPTTKSASPIWKPLSFGFGGLSLVAIVSSVILLICLCRLKRSLRMAHATMYPSASMPNEPVYNDPEDTLGRNKSKKSVKVELKEFPGGHDEEEIDSPTFSPAPPIPTSLPPKVTRATNDAPDVPKRLVRRKAPPLPDGSRSSDADGKNEQLITNENRTSSGSNASVGINNPTFEPDHHHSNGHVTTSLCDTADNIYEEYDDAVSKPDAHPLDQGMDNDDIELNNLDAYEKPVTSRNDDFLHRQASASGLPEMTSNNRSNSNRKKDSPLKVAAGGQLDVGPRAASGIPMADQINSLDDLQTYDEIGLAVGSSEAVSTTSGAPQKLGSVGNFGLLPALGGGNEAGLYANQDEGIQMRNAVSDNGFYANEETNGSLVKTVPDSGLHLNNNALYGNDPVVRQHGEAVGTVEEDIPVYEDADFFASNFRGSVKLHSAPVQSVCNDQNGNTVTADFNGDSAGSSEHLHVNDSSMRNIGDSSNNAAVYTNDILEGLGMNNSQTGGNAVETSAKSETQMSQTPDLLPQDFNINYENVIEMMNSKDSNVNGVGLESESVVEIYAKTYMDVSGNEPPSYKPPPLPVVPPRRDLKPNRPGATGNAQMKISTSVAATGNTHMDDVLNGNVAAAPMAVHEQSYDFQSGNEPTSRADSNTDIKTSNQLLVPSVDSNNGLQTSNEMTPNGDYTRNSGVQGSDGLFSLLDQGPRSRGASIDPNHPDSYFMFMEEEPTILNEEHHVLDTTVVGPELDITKLVGAGATSRLGSQDLLSGATSRLGSQDLLSGVTSRLGSQDLLSGVTSRLGSQDLTSGLSGVSANAENSHETYANHPIVTPTGMDTPMVPAGGGSESTDMDVRGLMLTGAPSAGMTDTGLSTNIDQGLVLGLSNAGNTNAGQSAVTGTPNANVTAVVFDDEPLYDVPPMESNSDC